MNDLNYFDLWCVQICPRRFWYFYDIILLHNEFMNSDHTSKIVDDGPTSLAPQINGSPCEEDEDSQCAEAMGSWVQLPVV